ncbi:MAG: hypothetical protein GF383_06730 [Candidatus Lokiarchaeota archaeon]|nr:hypothetical protein [Candidatus Lokiarchaeota archaeon]MBD3339812.1 hypothetical protein [Candidatus Lokiarchaeota archaeon]
MELTPEVQINGIITLIATLLVFLFCFIVFKKAIKKRERILGVFSILLALVYSPWYPGVIGYIYWLLYNDLLGYEFYIFTGSIFMPISLILWLYIYFDTIFPELRNKVLIFNIIFGVVFELVVLYLLFLIPNSPIKPLLGEVDSSKLDYNWSVIPLIFTFYASIFVIITGIHFSIKALRTDIRSFQLKGRFLLTGFIAWTIVAIVDSLTLWNPVIIIFLRLGLLIASLCFYIGFILPSWIRKLFSIED